MRKTFLQLLFILVATATMKAQTGINYQAVVRNSDGEILKNQNVELKFSVLKGSTSGTEVYAETHSLTTNNFGNVVAIIGQGTATTGTFTSIEWGNDKHFLNVKVDGTDMGTTQFMSVPYAINAESTNQAKMINETKVKVNANQDGRIVIGNSDPSDVFAEGLSAYKSNLTNGTQNGNRLVRFMVDTLEANPGGDEESILKLQTGSHSDSEANLIEGIKGGNTVFEVGVNGDLYAEEKIKTDGNITLGGEINRPSTGTANLLPIAYGLVSSSGTLITGTDNVSVVRSSTGTCDISIAGESGNYPNYIISTTKIGNAGTTRVYGNSVSPGTVRILSYNTDFTLADSGFYFVIYKP